MKNENDELIARFFSLERPECNSPDGQHVFELTLQILKSIASRNSIDDSTKKEIISQTNLELLNYLQSGQPVNARNILSLRAMLKRMFYFNVLDYKRKRKDDPLEDDEILRDPNTIMAGDILEATDMLEKSMDCVKSHNTSFYEILELIQSQQDILTPVEMATALEITRNNFDQRLKRARKAFRKCWESLSEIADSPRH